MLWHRDGAPAVMVNHVMMGDGCHAEETAAEERERRERCVSDQRFYLKTNRFLCHKPLKNFHY